VLSLEGWVDVRDILDVPGAPSHADYIHLFVFIGCPDRAHPICVFVANYSENKGTALLTVTSAMAGLEGPHQAGLSRCESRQGPTLLRGGKWDRPGLGSTMWCRAPVAGRPDAWTKQTNYTKYSVSQVLAMCAVHLHPAVRGRGLHEMHRADLLWLLAVLAQRFDASVTVAGVLWLVLPRHLAGPSGRSAALLRRGLRLVCCRIPSVHLGWQAPDAKDADADCAHVHFQIVLHHPGHVSALLLVYALSGVILFGNVKHGGGLNRQANFSHCWRATLLLLRIVTGEDWNKNHARLHGGAALLQDQHQVRKQSVELQLRPIVRPLSLYFCSFYIIILPIMLNILVAIIMENFSLFYTNDEDALLSHTDIRQFQNTWNLLDDSRRGSISLRKCKNSAENALRAGCRSSSISGKRSVDIRKSLQLPELLAARNWSSPSGGGGPSRPSRTGCDSCVEAEARPRGLHQLRFRPPARLQPPARPAADALAVAAGASIGGQVWLCSRRRRREGGKLVSEAQRRRLLRIDDLGGGSGRPASLTMGAKRRRPARAANHRVATVSAMAARSPTKNPEAPVTAGTAPGGGGRQRRRGFTTKRTATCQEVKDWWKSNMLLGPADGLVAKDLEDAFDEEEFDEDDGRF
uniref:Ion_trans domain-containing protein n=1 Tax=Macrostomum lignano TaxID=282301 RepID=A0A1I8FR61_9PLAT